METIGNRDPIDKSFGDIIRVSEMDKPYLHKIIDGPTRVKTIFYPILKMDEETKKMKQAIRVVTVDDYNNNIFSLFAKKEEEITKQKMRDAGEDPDKIKKWRSSLRSTTTFHCLVLDREDSVPVLRRAEYKKTVYDKMIEIFSKADAINTKALKHGLPWMLWLDIRRVAKDASKPADNKHPQNITYSVEVDKSVDEFKGKVPKAWYDGDYPIEIDAKEDRIIVITPDKKQAIPAKKIFSKEQWLAIINYKYNLADLAKPMDAGEAMDKVVEDPFYLEARDRNGNLMFPYAKEILAEMKKEGLALPPMADKKATGYLPEPDEEKQESLPEPKKESETEDAEFEELPFDKPEPKKESKKESKEEESTEEWQI